MALEIPKLQPDRLSIPEWSAGAAMGKFLVSAQKLLDALSSVTVPPAVLAALRPLASTGGQAELLLSADRGLVQVVAQGFRVTLTGAARDAALTVLGEQARGPEDRPATSPASATVLDSSTAVRAASVDAQLQEARGNAALVEGVDGLASESPHTTAAAMTPVLPGAPTASLLAPSEAADVAVAGQEASAHGPDAQRPLVQNPIPGPLMQQPDAQQAERSLKQAVAASGLFLEAHAAQWTRGERSLTQLQDEVRALGAQPATGTSVQGDDRAAAQLEALRRQALALSGEAWPGQRVQIEIERDRERNREAANAGDATGLFTATLALHLPHLGLLKVRIRVLAQTVAVQMETERPGALDGELPRLGDALSARGLNPAHLGSAPAIPGAA